MNPVVVIGAGRPNRLPALVCEYTIKRHCPNAEVVHTWDRPFLPGDRQGIDNVLHRDRWEEPCEWLTTGHPTGTMFSFARHMTPEIRRHKGHAIYFDSDMVVFASVQEIWELDMNGAWVLGVRGCHQTSVLKMDCAALKHLTIRNLLTNGMTYRALQKCRHLPSGAFLRSIPKEWNTLDRFYPKRTKLTHYTHMPTQPWIKPGHRAESAWFDQLAEAVLAGAISMDLIENEVRPQDVKATWPAACWPQTHIFEEIKKRL